MIRPGALDQENLFPLVTNASLLLIRRYSSVTSDDRRDDAFHGIIPGLTFIRGDVQRELSTMTQSVKEKLYAWALEYGEVRDSSKLTVDELKVAWLELKHLRGLINQARPME